MARSLRWAMPILKLSGRFWNLVRITHGSGKLGEELIGELLRRAVDEALADLRKLAADLRFDVVAQERAAVLGLQGDRGAALGEARSEEHTSELQSLAYLVCRLLLEKKKKKLIKLIFLNNKKKKKQK